jgi:hypothetical protein
VFEEAVACGDGDRYTPVIRPGMMKDKAETTGSDRYSTFGSVRVCQSDPNETAQTRPAFHGFRSLPALRTPGLDELLRCTEVCFRDRVSCVVHQSSDGRCLREADVELSPNAIHRAAKMEILPASHRDDAIAQRAEVVGDGLPVADPEPVEVVLYSRTRIAHLEYH